MVKVCFCVALFFVLFDEKRLWQIAIPFVNETKDTPHFWRDVEGAVPYRG